MSRDVRASLLSECRVQLVQDITKQAEEDDFYALPEFQLLHQDFKNIYRRYQRKGSGSYEDWGNALVQILQGQVLVVRNHTEALIRTS